MPVSMKVKGRKLRVVQNVTRRYLPKEVLKTKQGFHLPCPYML